MMRCSETYWTVNRNHQRDSHCIRIPDSRRRMRCGLAALAALAPCSVFSDSFILPPRDIDLVGVTTTTTTTYEDTLLDVARRHGLGYREIVRANPDVDPWLPGEGAQVVLPTRFILPPVERKGIVLNIPEMRLYYFPEPADNEMPVVITHPISIGRMDWQTPVGLTRVVRKVRNPSWYPPESIRMEHAADGRPLPKVVPPGPDNPLGEYALSLGLPGYLIHGTNKPAGVGMRVTHGCIRMYPEDIEIMFNDVPVNTPVRIINQPNKIGWIANTLFLEVHPPLDEDEELRQREMTAVTELLVHATRGRIVPVDWAKAREIFDSASGIPMAMSRLERRQSSLISDTRQNPPSISP